jgi:hypothetical protein
MSVRTIVTLLIVAAFLVIVAGFLPAPERTAAQTSGFTLGGWLWSSNIGWICLSSTTSGCSSPSSFGVTIGPSGNFSGYAWSNNIGWINFAPAQQSPDGSNNPAHINVTSVQGGQSTIADGTAVTGWIRACTVFQSGCSGSLKTASELGGWDGWIKMSGQAVSAANYGVTKTTSSGVEKLTGFAWGSDNIGWLNFYDVRATAGTTPPDPNGGDNGPTCTVTAQHDPGDDVVDAKTGTRTIQVTWSVEAHGANYSGDYDCGLPPTPPDQNPNTGATDVDNLNNLNVDPALNADDQILLINDNHIQYQPSSWLFPATYGATTRCSNVSQCWGDGCNPDLNNGVGDVHESDNLSTVVRSYDIPSGTSGTISGWAKVTISDSSPAVSAICHYDLPVNNGGTEAPNFHVLDTNNWVEILTHAAGLPSVPARNDEGQPAKIQNLGGTSGQLQVKSITSTASGESISAIAGDPAYYPKCSITVAADSNDNTIPPANDASWKDCSTGHWGPLTNGQYAKFSIKFPKRGSRFNAKSPYNVLLGDDQVPADGPITLYYSVGGISEY